MVEQTSLLISPVHGFPVRNSSCKQMLCFKDSTLVSSPIKLSVKSSFCNDSHRSKFSTFSTLFMAKFTYSSFFNLWRFSGWMQSRKRREERVEGIFFSSTRRNWIITNFRDQVRLQEENFKLTAPVLNVLDSLNTFLMQWKFLEAKYEKLVVLGLFPNEFFGDCNKSAEERENVALEGNCGEWNSIQFTFHHFFAAAKIGKNRKTRQIGK